MSTCESCGAQTRRVRTADGGTEWRCPDCDGGNLHVAVEDVFEALEIADASCEACGHHWWLSMPAEEYADLRCPECHSRRVATDARPALAFGLAAALEEVPGRGYREGVVAAACVYLASILADDKLTQADAAEAAGVSTSGMRQSYRDFYDESGFTDTYGEIAPGGREPEPVSAAIDVDGWRDHLKGKGATHGAVKTGASNVRRFAKWYDGDGDPTADDVNDWLEHLAEEGYAPSTIESRWGDIRNYFEWAEIGTITDADVDLDEHLSLAYQQKV